MEPWFTSTLYELMLFHMFNSMKHQTNFFFYLFSLEEIVISFLSHGEVDHLSGVYECQLWKMALEKKA